MSIYTDSAYVKVSFLHRGESEAVKVRVKVRVSEKVRVYVAVNFASGGR